jgi:DNA-binding winged helix-turn-helix (wHTH) protein/dipeptidyl aminopeptidase/acylaminoacyl peptidase
MRDTDSPPSVGFHPAARRTIAFEGFRFDFLDRTLSRADGEVPLPPRAISILTHLLERPGRIVSKQELLDAGWKDAHVSETSLTEVIGLLRQTFGDDTQRPRFIQTVHRRGYRFIAPIAVEAPAARALAAVPAPSEPTAAAPAVAPGSEAAPRSHAPYLVAGLAAVALGAAAIAWFATRPEAPRQVARVVITLPDDQAPAPGLNSHTALALSPEGDRIVYVAGHTGSYRLFLRALDRFDAVPIAGTAGSHGPFFAPDGRSIGFFRDGRLLRLPTDGGEPMPLADAKTGYGGSWADDGTIVFAPAHDSALWRVPAGGGDAVALTESVEGESHRWPDALPGGRGVLFTIWRAGARDARIAAWREGREPAVIVEAAVHPRYLPSGHLAFVRDGVLMVAPFDADTLRLTGAPVAAVNDIMTGLTGAGQFSIARSGALLYLPDDPPRRDRTVELIGAGGEPGPTPLPPRPYQNLSLAPDGRRVAATIPSGGSVDVWVGDLERGTLTRLTAEGTNVEPIWTPDGRHVLYASDRGGRFDIYRQAADGSAPAERLWSHPADEAPGSWSPDGRTLAFFRVGPGTSADIHLMTDGEGERPLVVTRASESTPRISPDGRWLAYQSNESGRQEIYVRALEGAGRIQVSADGGTAPAWVPGGADLMYRKGSRWLAVPVSAGPDGGPSAGRPRLVLDDPDIVLAQPAADGRLVIVRRTREHLPLTTMNLVLDWTQELAVDRRARGR